MKRVLLIGMAVLFAVVAALPAVAMVADNPNATPTGRSADPSFQTSARAEYNKPPKPPKPSKPSKPPKAEKPSKPPKAEKPVKPVKPPKAEKPVKRPR